MRAVTDIRTQITGLIATLGLWKAAQSGIGAASSLEDLELQFEALEGSAERARAKIAEIESAFGLRQAKRALELYSDLAAFGLKPTVDQMRSLIDFNAKLGKGQENLSGIVSQLGQAWGKQKLQYEDILILLERGVPVWDLLGKATGRTSAELQEMASNGQLGREAIAGLVTEMGKVADGASVRRLSTWSGLVEAAGDLWERFQAVLTRQGAFQYVKEQLSALADKLEELIQDGSAVEWGKQLAEAVRNGGEAIKKFVSEAGATFDEWREKVGGIGNFTGGVLDAMSVAWNGFIQAVELAAAIVTKALDFMLRGFALGAEGLAKLGAISDETAEKIRKAQEKMAKASENFAQASIKDWNDAGESLESLVDRFTETGDAAEETGSKTKAAAGEVAEAGETFEATADGMEKAAGKVEDGAKAAGAGIRQMADDTKTAVEEVGDLEDAFKRLGIESSTALRKSAEDARKDFETIANSGKASYADLQRAALAYAEKALESGDAVEQKHARAWAAVLNVSKAYREMEKAAKEASETAVKGHKEATAAADQQADAVTRAAGGAAPDEDEPAAGGRSYTIDFETIFRKYGADASKAFPRVRGASAAAIYGQQINTNLTKAYREWLDDNHPEVTFEGRRAAEEAAAEEEQRAREDALREAIEANTEQQRRNEERTQEFNERLREAGSSRVVVAIDGYEVARAIEPHATQIAERRG